jgi:hypothetical protein
MSFTCLNTIRVKRHPVTWLHRKDDVHKSIKYGCWTSTEHGRDHHCSFVSILSVRLVCIGYYL